MLTRPGLIPTAVVGIVLHTAVALHGGVALAAMGDCSQPSSSGSGPVASDCLYILKVAVGSLPCTPECICAPNGTLPAKSNDALTCLRSSVGQSVPLQCPCLPAADDFNDNTKDAGRWGFDSILGNGILDETGQVLQFTVPAGGPSDYVLRPWIAGVLPYLSDWTVQIDVANLTAPNANSQTSSFGVTVHDDANFGNEVFAELYASFVDSPPSRNGFYGELYDDDGFVESVDASELVVTGGAVRIAFDAVGKVLTLYYDIDAGNGYNWVPFGSFGVDGSGGDDGNANWGMSEAGRFTVGVHGYATAMTIGAGELFGDNFTMTGAVAP